LKSSEIRQRFLDFFASKDHDVVPSASLIPHNDPTLFFVNAGMVPFKDVFTGKEQRSSNRATSVQKCLRVSGKHNDLENVGRTPRHHTLFEMMGNFSFGDYFKPDACAMAWEFLTKSLGLPEERLWVTVFEEDDEAYDLWRSMGISSDRLQRMDAKENFWSMGATGPCGPCSEIHFDHGTAVSDDTRGPAGGGDRYVEIWNLVFMQYDQQTDGSRLVLPRPSIDTGSGLERVAAAMQGVLSNYDTDLFQGIIQRTASLVGTPYGSSHDLDVAMRVISDHSRATAFLISDGVMPSNEARGYVLRRIMRRAIRFGVKSGMEQNFLHHVVNQVIKDFAPVYPELATRQSFIEEVVQGEEARFRSTLDRGMKLLNTELERAGKGGSIPGDIAFTLSDTYGFPIDLTRLIAEEQGVGVNESGFEKAMESQRERGRAAWKGSGEQAVGELWPIIAEEVGDTTFTGYPSENNEGVQGTGKILAIVKAGNEDTQKNARRVDQLAPGEKGLFILDKTAFYGESGGQIGDAGHLEGEGFSITIDSVSKSAGLHIHHGVVTKGQVKQGQTVKSLVNIERRAAIRRNHTATHLLHAALRDVLGEHVTQKGSLVASNRLRFDFSHHKATTNEELLQIENQVNEQILQNQALQTSEMSLEQAKSSGAMALFGEKYDALVRVVSVSGYSTELCGGTHVDRTGSIGPFLITSEAGIAAGVRRIEAQTGVGALAQIHQHRSSIQTTASALKTNIAALPQAISKLQSERKALEKELATLKREMASAQADDLLGSAREIGGVKILAARFDGNLKEQADRLRDQLGSSLVVLASARGPKALLVAAVTKDIAGSRIHAGKVIKDIAPLIGGGGGGRPDMAQAGGKNPDGIPQALERVFRYAEEQLS
jgi:alanyl-tRNA synthetase